MSKEKRDIKYVEREKEDYLSTDWKDTIKKKDRNKKAHEEFVI